MGLLLFACFAKACSGEGRVVLQAGIALEKSNFKTSPNCSFSTLLWCCWGCSAVPLPADCASCWGATTKYTYIAHIPHTAGYSGQELPFHTEHPFAEPLGKEDPCLRAHRWCCTASGKHSYLGIHPLQDLYRLLWLLNGHCPCRSPFQECFTVLDTCARASAAWASFMHLKYPLWLLGRRKLKRMALTGHQRYKGPLYPGDISAFGAVFYLFKWLLLEPLSTVLCQLSMDF